MATSSPSFLKLANNDFSAGSSFVVNKGANGSTASAVIVFNAINGNTITAKTFKIGSVKVGGQNLFTEEIKIDAIFGAYSDSSGFNYTGDLGSCTVSESEKTTSKTISHTGSGSVADGYYPAVKITVSSTKSARGAEVVMSGFTLSLTYTANYTITTVVSGSGTVTGGGVWQEGATAKLTAKPNDGHRFVRWNDNVTTNPRDVKVTGNATYTAYFEKLPPEFTSASMTYLNKQIAAENKVIHNEGFIISVGIK